MSLEASGCIIKNPISLKPSDVSGDKTGKFEPKRKSV